MVTVDIFRFESSDAVHFPAGAEIFKEGDPGDLMYVVLEGEVRIAVHGVEVEKVGPGGVLGEMALIDNEPRSATAQAVTECRLVAIGERRFNFLVQQHPRFAIQIMRVMASRLRAAGRFI
jgi:CRP/FNR family cyclic AMP-dependent transcriptional regulator